MKAEIKNYTEMRIDRLKNLLQSYADTGDPELIHQIRIEIKKIKAILGLIKYNDKKFSYKKTFHSFRDIYRAGRSIREPLVLKSLAEANRIRKYPEINSNDELIHSFKNAVPVYIETVEKVAPGIVKAAGKISGDTYKAYLNKRNNKLKSLIYPTFKQADLHEVRILMKEIYHLHSIKKQTGKTLDFLKESETILGDWHDHVLLLDWVKKTASPSIIKKVKAKSRLRLRKLKELSHTFYDSKTM